MRQMLISPLEANATSIIVSIKQYNLSLLHAILADKQPLIKSYSVFTYRNDTTMVNMDFTEAVFQYNENGNLHFSSFHLPLAVAVTD